MLGECVARHRPHLICVAGHCWSQEDYFPPVSADEPSLRPSFAPKCNHAYAMSRKGALRLVSRPNAASKALTSVQLRHLRSPAFAYSRPFDQAIGERVRLIPAGLSDSFHQCT
jgi:hypothetical protein